MMTVQLRPYQEECVAAHWHYLAHDDGNPLFVVPTAGGKSHIIAAFLQRSIEAWPSTRAIVLTHVKELIEQNHSKYLEHVGAFASAGIYSAGIGARDTQQSVIFAGIQSMYNKADQLGRFDLVLVDECVELGTFVDGRPIEYLVPGDLASAYDHALGVIVRRPIRAVSVRWTRRPSILIRTGSGSLRCTDNHPIYTKHGYQEAATVQVGDCVLMQRVRGRFQPEQESVQGDAAERFSAALFEGVFLPTTRPIQLRTDAKKESNEEYGDPQAHGVHAPCNTPSSTHTGREGSCVAAPTKNASVRAGKGLDCGEGSLDRHSEMRWSNLVLGGSVLRQTQTHRRGGRSVAFLDQRSRSSSRLDLAWTRVLDVEVQKRAGFEGSGLRPVFNLQVDQCENFFADGVLVHNCHLIPKKGEGRYLTYLKALREINPHVRVLGYTATHYRLDGGYLHKGPGRIFTDVAYEIPIDRLVREGFLSPLIGKKPGAGSIDTSGIATVNGDFKKDDLEAAAMRAGCVEAAIAEVVCYGREQSRRSWLLFSCGIEHGSRIGLELTAHGISWRFVHGGTPKDERKQAVEQFKRGEFQALVNVGVYTTGFDAPNVDLLALLRATQSTGLYVQICLDDRTEILTRSGWRGIGCVSGGDEVAALDMATGLGEWSRVLSTVDRPMEDGERFVSIQSPRLDIRVTDQHDLVISTRRFRGRHTGWKKVAAERALMVRDGFRIPASVNIDAGPGVPLTDHDLRFAGLFMTDGTFNPKNNAITLYQSERYPEVLAMIESTLRGCGMKYGHGSVVGDECFGKPRTIPLHRFWISKGMPRGRDKHLRGWGYLEPFLSKDLALRLMDCTRAQLDVLLGAIHAGDGSKTNGPTWVRRSYCISTGNRMFADRLQSLCVTRGLAANMSEHRTSRRSTLYLINISPRAWRDVGGAGQTGRQSLIIEPSNKERVWCVETEHGTVLTRRNGKVAVVGNCGRGMRLSPATGKKDCLVLDFGTNIERHGPVDRVKPKRESASGESPVKACPKCASYVPAGVATCPDCGYVFPARVMDGPSHEKRASHQSPMSTGNEAPTTFDVTGVFYRDHVAKSSGLKTLRVDYLCGMRAFSEFVCLDHSGFALRKAQRWWLEHSTARGSPVPSSVLAALERVSELRAPAQIDVVRDGKYERVARVRWTRRTVAVDPGAERSLPADG